LSLLGAWADPWNGERRRLLGLLRSDAAGINAGTGGDPAAWK
jgi:hypothetical protein